ncbi:1,4-dihydroxy-2-naphthoate prenyltransferase [Mycobacterium canettii]|nr:1,4-dihydroxy-2-naphthoate prenyltransferase [Mycobacterium canetti]CCK54414.1 Putative 1,4-Dihydroxy-2-naphtoate prenyltransferase (part1) [Mycobacterium canettii CIPT 140070008]
MPDAGAGSRLRSWAYALRTTNPPADGPTDTVTRGLVVTRAAVLPMTLVSGLVAGLLAIGEPGLDWRWLVLAVVGITCAHIANNLMNDLYDTDVGTDSATYARARYAPHPAATGANRAAYTTPRRTTSCGSPERALEPTTPRWARAVGRSCWRRSPTGCCAPRC